MVLSAGTRLGVYEVLAAVGAGGMGEVYRARDTKLGREVAIKVLPDMFAEDVARLARFEREAKLLAQLNHTNIATLHGLEESNGQRYLVMELVEGETLAERIAGGPIPLDEAQPLFVQMAEGLEAAHEKGIVHRDLKPANVKITPEGKVKILDFGLARLAGADSDEAGAADSRSPTLTKGTALGVILGTACYMSPEQARGKPVDKRTDIWAFGCCLFEALTGKRVFAGETVTDILAAVVKSEPPWSHLPPATPRWTRRLLERCLKKDPRVRLHDIADARIELEEVRTTEIPKKIEKKRGYYALSFLAGLLTAGVVFWAFGIGFRKTPSGAPNLDLTQLTGNPVENTVLSGVLSPDGKYLAYVDLSGVVVRLMETGETHAVPVPDGLVVDEVDWFPDGTTLLLETSSADLWKTSVFGGTPRKVADHSFGAAVSPKGDRIAYLSSEQSPSRRIYVTGSNGENPDVLAEAADGDSFWEPAWSPDGRWLLFGNMHVHIGGIRARQHDPRRMNTIDAVSIGTKVRKVVLSDARLWQSWRAALPFLWTTDGRLVYGRRELSPNEQGSNLWSLPIDSEAVVHGEPVRVTQLTGVNVRDLSETSDGRGLAFLAERNQSDVYVLDLQDSLENERRLTFDERDDYPQAWFSDGTVLLSSNRTGRWNIYRYEQDEQHLSLLVSGSGGAVLTPDGSFVLYANGDEWMRAPTAGGPGERIATGEQIHCAVRSQQCVLGERDRKTNEYVFFKLDPLEGRQGEVLRIVDNPPFTNWDISPDGDRLAVVHNDGRIRIVEIATGTEHVITNENWFFGEFVSFSADGKAVFLDGSRSGRGATTRKSLLRVSLEGKSEVEELRYRRNVWHVRSIASPDGRHVAFAAMTFSANVWMIEGF